MKIFAKMNFWKKVIVILTLFTSMAVVAPKPVEAGGAGGELMEPICDFLVAIGDSVVGIIHRSLINQEETLIRIDTNKDIFDILKPLAILIAFIAVATLIIAAAVAVGAGLSAVGLALAGEEAAKITIGAAIVKYVGAGTVAFAIVGGGYVALKVSDFDWWNKEVVLPMYTISPEEIFRNDKSFPLFDVNFVNPPKDTVEYQYASVLVPDDIKNATYTNAELTDLGMTADEFINKAIRGETKTNATGQFPVEETYYYLEINKATYRLTRFRNMGIAASQNENQYTYSLSKTSLKISDYKGANGLIHSYSYDLQKIISTWYNRLRILAIVGMMSVLVYIGIRITISSTSSQKAKYKQLLKDWFVGIVLVFTMHYIMVFSNLFVSYLTDALANINPGIHSREVPDIDGKVSKALQQANIKILSENDAKTSKSKDAVVKYNANGTDYIEWDTNLMGAIRMELQNTSQNNATKYLGYTLMFLVMVFLLLFFIWTYIKRVVYMAFLTMISPLVALTYPIDKVNDGQAQGFNYWFKEYIFNLLLQPMHLLIYTILVSSAFQLATTNWIYSLVALGFIATSEKIVRTMFNFSKASTPGVFAGPAGAALTMTGMRWLFGHGPKGGSRDGRNLRKGEEENEKTVTPTSKTSINDGLNKFLLEDGQVDNNGR